MGDIIRLALGSVLRLLFAASVTIYFSGIHVLTAAAVCGYLDPTGRTFLDGRMTRPDVEEAVTDWIAFSSVACGLASLIAALWRYPKQPWRESLGLAFCASLLSCVLSWLMLWMMLETTPFPMGTPKGDLISGD